MEFGIAWLINKLYIAFNSNNKIKLEPSSSLRQKITITWVPAVVQRVILTIWRWWHFEGKGGSDGPRQWMCKYQRSGWSFRYGFASLVSLFFIGILSLSLSRALSVFLRTGSLENSFSPKEKKLWLTCGFLVRSSVSTSHLNLGVSYPLLPSLWLGVLSNRAVSIYRATLVFLGI